MAKLLSDETFAVRGRLVAIDNSVLVGPLFTLRVPPNTSDIQRPGSYVDFVLLDTHRKTLQKRIHVDDELSVIIHAATAEVAPGVQNEMTFHVEPASRSESEFAGGLVYNKDGWNYQEREPEQLVYTIETGTLQMMITDTASGTRIWRGTLQTKLDRSQPIEKQQELFQRAARKLLERLPSGSK